MFSGRLWFYSISGIDPKQSTASIKSFSFILRKCPYTYIYPGIQQNLSVAFKKIKKSGTPYGKPDFLIILSHLYFESERTAPIDSQ